MMFFPITLFAVICVYALLLLFARFFAERIIFPAPPPSYSQGNGIFFIDSPDGGKIAALFLPSPESDVCVIYSHGNGEDLGEIRPILEEYAKRGVSVFAYDYRGYGLSGGKPSIAGLKASARAAYGYVSKTLGYADTDIAVVGYSLGSAAACEIADLHPNIRCAVIVGGFSKAVKAVLPVNIVPWEILDNSEKIARFKMPVLFLHGRRDIIVPFRNARENFKKAPDGGKKLVIFPEKGHYYLHNEPLYWGEIINFVVNGGFISK